MRAIFLDRDGVICVNRSDHVKSWVEFEFLPGAKKSLAELSHLDLPIVIATNQAIVGRGIIPLEVIEEIHQRMIAEITAEGGRIDRVIYCPHCPEDLCECRKPRPGMLLQVAQEMGIELTGSYLVGDAASDIQAGHYVGCRTFLVLTGRGVEQLVPSLHASSGRFLTVTRNLAEVVEHIVKAEKSIAADIQRPGLTYMGRYRQLLATTIY